MRSKRSVAEGLPQNVQFCSKRSVDPRREVAKNLSFRLFSFQTFQDRYIECSTHSKTIHFSSEWSFCRIFAVRLRAGRASESVGTPMEPA
jgi:hypothetical protein